MGVNNVTEMNDILFESGADGVTDLFPASARSHLQRQGIDKGTTSRKVLGVILSPSNSFFLAKDVCHANSMSLVLYSPVVSPEGDCRLHTTCRNSRKTSSFVHTFNIYWFWTHKNTVTLLMFLLRVPRLHVHGAMSSLRGSSMYSSTRNVYTEGVNITFHGYISGFTNQINWQPPDHPLTDGRMSARRP